MNYPEEAELLWRRYVPAHGQADTVQGELIRAVAKLADEAQRNGNMNWDSGHVILATFLRDVLMKSGVFEAEDCQIIAADVDRVLQHRFPVVEDTLYDRLSDRVVEWSRAQAGPVKHETNPDLHR